MVARVWPFDAPAGIGDNPRRPVSVATAVFSLIGCLVPGVALAQEGRDSIPRDSVFTIEEISVRVARPVATAGGASAVTARLDSMFTSPSPTLEELLRQIPLIQIRENSRGEAQPQLRGMESRNVAVLVDDVPLTLGWDNRTDLSVIPLTAARELTLVRGLSSVLHGPNALGGVVLVSIGDLGSTPARPPPFHLSAGLDHLGSSAFSLGVGTLIDGAAGELLLRAGGGYRQRSSYPVAGGIGQPPIAADDERINSDFEQYNGYVVARYAADNGPWVSLSSFGFTSERGVPPELHVSDPRLWRYPLTSRWVTAVSGGTGWGATPWGEGDLEASLGLDFGETEIDTYESLAYDSVTGGETGDDRTLTLRLLGDHSLGQGVLRGALTLAETRHKELIDPDERATYRQRLWSLGLEAEQPLLTGVASPRTRVSVGMSVDGADTPETGGRPSRDAIWGWGARAGGTVALGTGDVLFHGGVSRRIRFPALRELYSGALGRFVVNENLDPEVLVVGEVGATTRRGAFELQAVGFAQRLSDAIERVTLGDGRLQRQNRDRLTSLGVEVLASYAWRGVSLAGDVTLKDVELEPKTADKRHAEYQPSITGGAELTVPLAARFWATGRVRHIGARYCVHPDLESEVRLSADSWLDLEVGRRFQVPGSKSVEGLLALDNVTDAAVFDQCGLPQPGRLLRFQVNVF